MIKIIIAEDEEEVRTRLVRHINESDTDYQVIGQAGDGSEALALVRELQPDILLTDICMPEVSGLELLRAVRENDQELPVIVISGYDEFSYAKEAMSLGVREYLLKPFLPKELFHVLDKTREVLEQRAREAAEWQSMNEELQKNIRYSRQRFFHSLLRGRLGWQEREVTAAVIGFDLQADWYCAGILGAETPDNDVHAPGMLQLLEQLWQGYFSSACRLHPVLDERERILLFFTGQGQTRRELAEQIADGMERICGVLRGQEDVPVRCALGRLCQSYDTLERSYREALDIWRVSLAQEKSVHTYPAESVSVLNAGEKSEALIEKLLLDLQMGEKKEALAGLDALLACYGSCPPSMAEKISMRLFRLVLQISELMRDVDEQEVAWSEQNLIGYLRQHFSTISLWEVRGMLAAYVERCCEHFARRNAADSDKLIYRACMVIDENIGNEEFDLDMLAQKLYFSATYVRQLFKSKMGESFSDYLFRRRMELAGQLMRNQALKVQDIAERTGYRDQRYFARCFKKYYHCTPTEYRSRTVAF